MTKGCTFTVNIAFLTKVRIWSGFWESSPKKNQNRSGFSLVFLKFRSGFSLDLANLGPEYKVAALNLNK